MKWTKVGYNFTSILRTAFFILDLEYRSAFHYLQFVFVILWQKEITVKAAHKMLLNVSISPTLYELFVHKSCFEQLFSIDNFMDKENRRKSCS